MERAQSQHPTFVVARYFLALLDRLGASTCWDVQKMSQIMSRKTMDIGGIKSLEKYEIIIFRNQFFGILIFNTSSETEHEIQRTTLVEDMPFLCQADGTSGHTRSKIQRLQELLLYIDFWWFLCIVWPLGNLKIEWSTVPSRTDTLPSAWTKNRSQNCNTKCRWSGSQNFWASANQKPNGLSQGSVKRDSK